jgi:elongation factor Ts
MAITAKDVNKLRQMTGAGMMDCKKALVEADGDFDGAIEILRKKGQKVAEKRADRETSEGSVFVQTSEDNQFGVIVALGCETDFVAKNADFQKLGNDIAKVAFESKADTIDALKEQQIGGRSVNEVITEMIGKIGEKIDILAYETLASDFVAPYVHAGSKLGVLVALKNTDGADVTDAGRDVGMQIAAMNPIAVDESGVPDDVKEREMEIGREQAKAEGKPDAMLDKIAAGKLNKYFKDNTLLPQPFVKDNSLTVQKYLDSVNKGMTVTEFKRVQIG